MAVRIRMKQMGRHRRHFFRICVADSRSPRDGKTIEEIGTYDPFVKDKSARVTLNMDRLDYWMSVGAQPSERVATLIDKVKENRWTSAKPAPKMLDPKQPEPEAAPAAEEGAEGETAEATEAPAEA